MIRVKIRKLFRCTKQLEELFNNDCVGWVEAYSRDCKFYKISKQFYYYEDNKLVGHLILLNDYIIAYVVVHRDYVGRGIASKLVKRATLHDRTRILGCYKNLVSFYVRLGFRVIKVDRYEDERTHYIMEIK